MGLSYPPSSGSSATAQPTGASGDKAFYENARTVNSNYTLGTTLGIPANAVTAGPITIANGVTVTVPDGSTYTVV